MKTQDIVRSMKSANKMLAQSNFLLYTFFNINVICRLRISLFYCNDYKVFCDTKKF